MTATSLLTSPAVAVTVHVPVATPVITPSATVAFVSSDDFHVTAVPSGLTVALTVLVAPTLTDAVFLSSVNSGLTEKKL